MWVAAMLIALGTGAFEYQDSFDGPSLDAAWFPEALTWEAEGGRLVCEGETRSAAVLESAPYGAALTVEASVTVEARRGERWGIAGAGVQWDGANYWHLALIEAPPADGGRRFVELTEMLDGAWLSQNAEATRLTSTAYEGADFNWEYGVAYRLRPVLRPEGIDGFIFSEDGTQRAHLGYAFNQRAVTAGKPMVDGGGFRAGFDEVRVSITAEAQGPAPKVFPPYAGTGNDAVHAEATGFFYPKEIDGRWWLIDPKGQSFFMIGTDHASYHVHWCEKLGYAPYARNVAEKYGSEAAWADETARRLADWGFNTLPANHSPLLRYRSFPHIEFLSLGASFSDIDDICPKTTWTGFPNVFSDKWARHCDRIARQRCKPNAGDPWLVGYFLDNELEWFGKQWSRVGLFNETWKKPAEHSAKKAWVEFLRKKLASPQDLETLWGVKVDDFDALLAHTEPQAPKNEQATEIAREWVRLVAEEYFRVCAEAIRRYDPNHLVLGCRFAGDAPEVWDIAGRYCDIVSFNMYPRIDVDLGVPQEVIDKIAQWQQEAARPMMITEWSFPALDAGLPSVHGAGMRVDTQAQRAACFTHFQKMIFSLPFMVGTNYFMWADEPAEGISTSFPEDSNYGLVNVNDEPYAEITNAARALHPHVYALHTEAAPQAASGPPSLPAWLREVPSNAVVIPAEGLKVQAGNWTLEAAAGGDAWRMSVNGTLLGALGATMHQKTAGSRWVAGNAARITGAFENDRVRTVEMELAYTGAGPEGTPTPRRYRSGWRFWIPRGGSAWLASQCLWVENADEAPWTLSEVFAYLHPQLGGSAENDEPLLGEVPNYYQRGAAWVDRAAGLGFGCWYPDERAFTCYYWKDPGSGLHSDLRQPVEEVLAPGQRYTMPPAYAFFFPLEHPSLAAFGATVSAIERDTR